MSEKSQFANEFIDQFVRHLIVNSKKEEFAGMETQKIEKIFPPISGPSEIRVHIVPPPKDSRLPIPQRQLVSRPIRINLPPVTQNINQNEWINLGKLSQMLSDPRVESVECQGPDKNIILKKSGTIQNTNIILNAEEISSIVNDFSQKTRIPLIEGTFKAAYGSLIMSAVISEIVGTRFIIQKKKVFR